MSSIFTRALRRAVIAMALMTGVTCDSIDNIDVDAGGTVEVPAGTLIDTIIAPALDFTGYDKIDFSQDFKNQGVSKGDVDAVRLVRLTLTVVAPSDGDFDFLDAISFSAEASGAARKEIARIASIPKGAREITLDVVEGVELAPYVTAPSMRITASVEGKKPSKATTVKAAAVFDVDIHIPGCN